MHGERGSDAITWNMSLQYQATQDTMYYATLSKGYKSGGFGPLINVPARFAFDPEYVAIWSLASSRIGHWQACRCTNAAVFYDKYTQQQLQISQVVNGFSPISPTTWANHPVGDWNLLPTDRSRSWFSGLHQGQVQPM
jgi:iron complex outermembrane receptor protein